jgi:hypothetical protein
MDIHKCFYPQSSGAIVEHFMNGVVQSFLMIIQGGGQFQLQVMGPTRNLLLLIFVFPP